MKASTYHFFLFTFLLCGLFTILLGEQGYFACAIIIWTSLVFYSIKNLNDNSALLAFLIGFFNFLMGRQILERLNMHTVELVFSEDLNIHAERLICLSLLCFTIGVILFRKVKFVIGRHKRRYSDATEIAIIKYVSRTFFLLTFPFNMLNVIDAAAYVLRYGYLAYYTSYSYSLPYIARKLADISIVAFWIYMATMPRKRECRLEIGLYLLYLVTTLFTGKRYPFVSGMLIFFVYATYRNSRPGDEFEKWYKKRTIIMIVLAMPFLVGILSIFNDIRFGKEITNSSIIDAITSFVYQQGGSINFIKRAELYKMQLPENKLYMFGNIIRILKQNAIGRILGSRSYSGNTVDNALYGNSMAHALSYIVLKKAYLEGNGLGSCFIAEAYHDFGYFGVAFVSLFYGYIFSNWFRFSNNNIWGNAVKFLVLRELILAPRGSVDGFVGRLLDITTWGTVLIIHFITTSYLKRVKKPVVL